MSAVIALTCISSENAPVSKWELKKHNGVMTPFHNGQPKLLNILYDNDSWYAKYMGVLTQGIAKEAHINMHMMHVSVDMADNPVPELSAINSSNPESIYVKTQARIEKLMQADPDAYIMIRVTLWPPNSWKTVHKDEMVQDEKGNIATSLFAPASIFSDKFFDKFNTGLDKMVRFLENGKYGSRILGYQPMTGYSGEWNRASTVPSRIADYSPTAQKAFRAHLLEKHKNVAGINSALGTNFKSEAEICVPSETDFTGTDGDFFKSPDSARYTREYLQFNSETVAKRILMLCKTIKDINPDRLVGTSYSYWFGEAQGGIRGLLINGHLSWPMLGNSPYIDYLLSPPYYALCGPSAPTTNHCLLGSLALYGKTYLEESDHPTHLICHMPDIISAPIIWTYKMGDTSKGMLEIYQRLREKMKKLSPIERSGIDFGKNYRQFLIDAEKSGKPPRLTASDRIPSNMQESVANTLRLGINVVTKPIGGIWWWDMEGCSRKSTGGISYNHPEILKALRRIADMFKAAVDLDRSSSSQVAVFYSTESLYYAKAGMQGWEYLRDSIPLNLRPLGECGIPYDDYYFEDIEKIPNIDQYRLLIFVNAHYITKAKRAWIERTLKKDSKVLVWFYGSGYLDETSRNVANMESLTGIRLKEINRREMLAAKISGQDKLIEKIPAGTVFGSYRTDKRKSPLAKPHFVVSDPQASVLGLSYKRGEANFAVKRMKNWTSVYLPGGELPTRLLKNLAREAKINVYTDAEDIQVWANKTMLGLYSYPSVKGRRTIALPSNVIACKDFFTGQEYVPENHTLNLEFNGAQAYFFILKTK